MVQASFGAIAVLFLAGGALVLLAPFVGLDAERAGELRRMFWVEFLIVVPVIGVFLSGGWIMAVALGVFAVRGAFELNELSGARNLNSVAVGILVGCGPAVQLISHNGWAGWLAAAAAPVILVLSRRLTVGLGAIMIALGGALVATQVLAGRPDGSIALLLVFVMVETCDSFAAVFGRIWGADPFAAEHLPEEDGRRPGGRACRRPAGGSRLGHRRNGTDALQGFGGPPSRCWPQVSPGDVLTSAVKRHFKRKDFPAVSALHGGILDIFDSLLVAIPVFLIAC